MIWEGQSGVVAYETLQLRTFTEAGHDVKLSLVNSSPCMYIQ